MGDLAENKPEENIETTQPTEGDGQQEVEDVEIVLEGDDETPPSQSVPLARHIELKKKLKGEKQESQSKDETIQEMSARLKALEQERELYALKQKQESAKPELTFPSRKDFTDEFGDLKGDEYDAAVSNYHSELQSRIAEQTKQTQETFESKLQELQSTDVSKKQDSALDAALERSVKEAEELNLKDYESAAATVAQSMPPGSYETLLTQGVVDAKTTYYLAKNPEKIQHLVHTANTQGEYAAIKQLMDLSSKLKPKGYQSPPEPDTPVTGAKGAGSNDYQKQLDKLRASSDYDASKAIEIKKQARAAGFEVR